MNRPIVVAVVGLALAVAACAAPTTKRVPIDEELARREAEKQRDLAIEQWVADQNRLSNIAHRLLTGAAELCGDRVRPMIGMSFLNAPDIESDFQAAARRYNGGSDVVHVVGVMDGSPAAAARIQPGYALIRIGDWVVPVGKGATAETVDVLKDAPRIGEPLTLTLYRVGDYRVVEVVPEAGCDYDVRIHNDDSVNAFADGDNVAITMGMMRFAETDTELATVVAHEMAHNAMGHIDAKRSNRMLGAGVGFIVDVLAAAVGVPTQGTLSRLGSEIASGAYSQAFESEADYVGLYIMARAGMDVRDTPDFWRRMAVAHPQSIGSTLLATHPPTPERFIGLENGVAEITGKRAAGLPLVPEMEVEPPPRVAEADDAELVDDGPAEDAALDGPDEP